jgi:hypothetical protein
MVCGIVPLGPLSLAANPRGRVCRGRGVAQPGNQAATTLGEQLPAQTTDDLAKRKRRWERQRISVPASGFGWR